MERVASHPFPIRHLRTCLYLWIFNRHTAATSRRKMMLSHRLLSPFKTASWARSLSSLATAASPTSATSHTDFVPAARSDAKISHSPWKTIDSVPLSRQSMLDLLYGKTPLIKEPGFLSKSECAKYEKALSPLVTPYTHNTGPTLRRVGIAQVRIEPNDPNPNPPPPFFSFCLSSRERAGG